MTTYETPDMILTPGLPSALLTTLASVVLRCTWGTPVYGLMERLVLGLGMCWISGLATRALVASRHRA